MDSRTSKTKLSALKCEIVNGLLTITVSADLVKYATEHHPDFYDVDSDVFRVKVADEAEWLKSVSHRLTHVEEGGSTLLSDVFDAAIYAAVDQGDEGLVDE